VIRRERQKDEKGDICRNNIQGVLSLPEVKKGLWEHIKYP
jgi:hypothetical protein